MPKKIETKDFTVKKEFVVKYSGSNPFSQHELWEALCDANLDDMGILEVEEVKVKKDG